MLTLTLLLTATSLQFEPSASDSVRRSTRARPPITVSVAEVRTLSSRADEHLVRARKAIADGAFDIARFEYSASIEADRLAGRLSREALEGLSKALYAQSFTREAAFTLVRLADDALHFGDRDTEATALADAVWIHWADKQYLESARLGRRLQSLLKDVPISVDARAYVKERVG